MQEIKKEVVDKVVSDDGRVTKLVGDGCSIEQAKAYIKEYEDRLSTVLFQRMLDRGVLHELTWKHYYEDKDRGTPEYVRADFLELWDGIIEDYNCCLCWYKFKPTSEEDVKDILLYLDMIGCGLNNKEYLGGFCCRREDVVAGEGYMLALREDDDNVAWLYKISDVRKRVNACLDYIEGV